MELDILIPIIVILIRLFIPLTILRWPLLGAFLAILGDISDIVLLDFFGVRFFDIDYHIMDKIFDTWYLFLEFLVVRKWKDKLARLTGSALFIWRFIGFLVFMIFSFRLAFVLAPNIFEFFFIGVLVIWKFRPKFKFTKKSLVILLLIVGIPNIIKEFFMHYLFTNNEVWGFFRDNLFGWLFD